MINTKKVKGRRQLRFESTADIVAEAKRLANAKVRVLGNWQLAQIFEHLTKSIDLMIDKSVDYKPPLWMRIMIRMFKGMIMNGKLPAGARPPADVAAAVAPSDDKEVQEALAGLIAALERFEQNHDLGRHPLFGKMTADDYMKFNCRHCELHMSFVVEDES